MQKSSAFLVSVVAAMMLTGCGGITGVQLMQAQPQAAAPEPQARMAPPPQQMAPAADRARLHTDLGTGYYQRGQMDVAINELNQAVGIDPSYAPAYNIYGLVYAMLGDDRKAEQSFQHALELAPNDSDVLHNWGWYLCQHKREREALAQFEIAVRNPLYRTPEVALVNAGRCAITLGDMRVAESYFRRALVAQPGNALAAYGLALIAYKEARFPEARNWMKGVMQANNPAPESLY